MVVETAILFIVLPLAIVLVASLFVVWVMVSIGRAIFRLRPSRRPQAVRTMTNSQFCTNEHCRTENPPHARFCRRCGQSLPMLMKTFPSAAA